MSQIGNRKVLAANLRSLMERRGLDRQQVCDDLGIKYTTFTDWYNGNKYPRIDKLELLADYFGVRKADLIEEQGGQPRQSAPSSELLDIEGRLNEAGRQEWIGYGHFLAEQPAYRRIEGQSRFIRHYLLPAAAGYASPVEGEDYEVLDLPDVPLGADYCITVSGDSMEPYIRDGSLAFVRRSADLEDFDVGVFFLDGDVLVKQVVTDPLRNVYLLSANPRRQDANRTVLHDSSSVLVCLGKVIINKLPRPKYV